jgi:LPS sulfotransferase NodH
MTATQSIAAPLSESPILEDIRPINWRHIRYWVRETKVFDQHRYKRKPRPVTLGRIKGLFSPNLKRPIFIVGAPRSGTTFLGECLAQLPELSYHFEPVVIKAAAYFVYTEQWSDRKINRFYPQVYAWLMRLYMDADLRLAEKTPRNSLVIPALHQAFPDAQFIFILRDGRDAALSLSKKPWYANQTKGAGLKEPAGYVFGPEARFWVEPHRAEEFEHTSDIHRCVWIWRQYVEKVIEASASLPKEQFYQVKYEDLVSNPEPHTSQILDFLGIEQTESRNILQQYIKAQANPSSIGLWRKQLDSEQVDAVEAEAGELLTQLGY